MAFYHNSFGGSLNVMTIGESPVKDQMPAEKQDMVMHAVMTSDRVMIMGSDMIGDEGYVLRHCRLIPQPDLDMVYRSVINQLKAVAGLLHSIDMQGTDTVSAAGIIFD